MVFQVKNHNLHAQLSLNEFYFVIPIAFMSVLLVSIPESLSVAQKKNSIAIVIESFIFKKHVQQFRRMCPYVDRLIMV